MTDVVCIHCKRSGCESVDSCRAYLAAERRRLEAFEPFAKLGIDPALFPYVLRVIFDEHDAAGTAQDRLDNALNDWINAAKSDLRFGRLASEPTPRRLREAIAVAVEYMGRVTKAESRAAVLEEGIAQLLDFCTRQLDEKPSVYDKREALQVVSLAIMKLRREAGDPKPLENIRDVAVAVRAHAGAWDDSTRLIGNVRADELAALAQFALTALEPSR
jgi:hypothetical protein